MCYETENASLFSVVGVRMYIVLESAPDPWKTEFSLAMVSVSEDFGVMAANLGRGKGGRAGGGGGGGGKLNRVQISAQPSVEYCQLGRAYEMEC